ncbi:MAG: ZIP family metal transporter [bacterium]
MKIWLYALTSVIFVSFLSLLGVFTLSFKRVFIVKIVNYMVAFAVGALLGGALIHLIPEAFEKIAQPLAAIYVLSGFFFFFLLENVLRWRHCHAETNEEHPHPVAVLNLVGDGVHNLIDGLIIGAAYLVSIPLGLTTTLAVVLHEIPQEIGDFGVLLHAGFSIPKALFYNFLSALLSVIGVIIVLIIGPQFESLSAILLAITAGGFIYIAASDLIPEIHHKCEMNVWVTLTQFVFVLLGVLTMSGLLLLD